MTAKKPAKRRLDALLVERGLVETRTKAAARILAGDVIVDDHRVDKPGTLIKEDAAIRVKGTGEPYVSRGGRKLDRALQEWPVPVAGAVCVDVGASTGGFTDALLHKGAVQVFAVDVGWGQLAEKLRQDVRVINMERTHVGKLPKGAFSPAPSIAVVDVSFISLVQVLPHVVPQLQEDAWIVVLVKPQFEAGRDAVGKGGIVRDEAARKGAVEKVRAKAVELGLTVLGVVDSPITGADGNVEYLMALRKTAR